MSDIHDNIKLTRQDIRELENEQKELLQKQKELTSGIDKAKEYKQRESLRWQHAQACERLRKIEVLVERKQSDLQQLVDSLQLAIFNN